MSKIIKLNLFLNEYQYEKLCLVAESLNKTPEEVANNSVYAYLSIVDPWATDDETGNEEQ